MPSALPATIAEREAELMALQSAFDEYIASSRELEEELDAELAKMQERLSESTAANRALSAQLENIAPQLQSLETSLTDARRKVKEEQELRRRAEQGQDDAEQRLRELEETIQHMKEEADVVHEELAFKESELEEARLELDVERQQLQNELNEAKASLQSAEARLAARATSLMDDEATDVPAMNSKSMDSADSVPSVDEAYVKKLEEELELVTEQLIETENRLSETEGQLQATQSKMNDLQYQQGRSEEDDELIRHLQTEMADRLESESRLLDEMASLKEELSLAKEEISLQQEELNLLHADGKANLLKIEEDRAKHREEVTKLTIQVKEAEVASRTSLGEAALVASTVQKASEENEDLRQELAALEAALMNAKADYQGVLNELEAVNARFDEARYEARKSGRDEAVEEMKSTMKADVEHEVNQLREHLAKLTQENTALQQKVDDTEISLAAIKDSQDRNVSGVEVQSEVVRQLQTQLARTKDDMAKKEKEMSALTTTMEERLQAAEVKATELEAQLHSARGHLAEAEARVVVLRRDKEQLENTTHIPQSPRQKRKHVMDTSAAPPAPSLSRLSVSSSDREELSSMDESPLPRRYQTPSSRDRPRSTSPSSVMRLEYRLHEESKKLEDLQKEYNSLLDQKRMSEVRIKRLEEDLRLLHKELFQRGGESAIVTQMGRLSSLASNERGVDLMAQDEDEGKRLTAIIDSRDVKAISEELKALEKKFNSQREYNAQLLSKMLHLQGNIQVYCRVRPLTLNEIHRGAKEVVESLSETEVGCFDSRTNKWKSFAFDRVWGPDQSQQSVFQDVEPLALSVVDGFNACIFAYGQTGSGKTFTMEGLSVNNQYGISYRTIQKIFHLLNLRASQQRAAEMFVESENSDEPAQEVSFKFSLELGMLEIYCDEIYDLLATSGASMAEKKKEALRVGGKTSLEIRTSKEGRIEVPNLTKEKVTSIQEVMSLLKRGNANRATASTDMNEHSSRSHMVLSVDVMSGLGESMSNKGTLYLVDLAGSERVRKSHVEGDQLKEAGFINKSLSALGNVMEALDRKASHIPYRDSKLTYMLQDSLGGNSRTMMIVAICPENNSFDESIHALQFATRVRRIQIGAAQRNVTARNLEETVKALTEEMRTLTRAKERSENQLHSLKRDNDRVQDKLKNLTKAKVQTKSDTKTLEVLRKNNDDMAARWEKEKSAKEEAAVELEASRKEQRDLHQQLGKMKSKITTLERKLEEKENELESANKRMRQERNSQTASTVRARRDEVLAARNRPATAGLQLPSTNATLTPARSVVTSQAVTDAATSAESGEDVSEIRSQVLALLEKHDQGKADRIDVIMEKFRGKEALLLEKMTQRYEGDSLAPTFQKRNELALQRHQERMKRIRENKERNGTASGTK